MSRATIIDLDAHQVSIYLHSMLQVFCLKYKCVINTFFFNTNTNSQNTKLIRDDENCEELILKLFHGPKRL